MPSRRYYRTRAPIQSNKHEVTWSLLAINAAGTQTVILAKSVKSADADTADEIEVGHNIRGIFLEFQFAPEDTTSTKVIHWQVEVVPVGMTQGTPAQYYQDDRSYILQRGMEMLLRNSGSIVKRIVFVRIPKIYSRMKQNQQIQFRFIASSTETINCCGLAIYKEKF